MRAIVYCRVSSDQTGEARSVESQEAECRAICERNGWEVADVLVDNDRGASRYSTKTRPEYKRLATVLATGDVDVLVTWEASRAQRDLAAYLALRDLCSEKGVLWNYSGRTRDLSDGSDRFDTGLDALLAEREAEQIRERVLRGKRAAAQAGRPGGRPPWGYRRDIDQKTGRTIGWVIDEEAEPIVREVLIRAIAGESIWAICRDLTARRIPTPQLQRNARQTWKPQALRVTISSPTYAGFRTHQGQPVIDDTGQRVKGQWPSYITPEDHERLLAIFSDPARKMTEHRGREPRHLLTGIATCGLCGNVMRFSDAPSHRTRAARYLCEARSCVGRRADAVDLLVEETLLERLSQPDAVKLFAERDNAEIKKSLTIVDTLRKRLAGFIDQASDGKITPESFAVIEAKLRPQIETAEAKARSGISSPLVAKLAGPDARTTWRTFSLVDQRTVARSLLTVTINRTLHGNTQRFDPRDVEIKWKG